MREADASIRPVGARAANRASPWCCYPRRSPCVVGVRLTRKASVGITIRLDREGLGADSTAALSLVQIY